MEISNKDYHADISKLSSSMLKLLLRDPQQFYNKYIAQTVPDEQKDVFDEGTLVHALLLEPHIVENAFAFYPGLRKAGEAWERFKEENKDKICMRSAQFLKCKEFAKAAQNRAEAMALISGGCAEHSMYSTLAGLPVKARADYINVEQGYIVDVKTTSYPAEWEMFRQTVAELKYGLSAALYCDIAEQTYNRKFDFYFVVISKSDMKCDVYKTSEETLNDGRAQYLKALRLFKQCTESGIWLAEQSKVDYSSKNYEIMEV